MTELGLRQPIGGRKVMARQVRHLIDLAEKPNITISVLPANGPSTRGCPARS